MNDQFCAHIWECCIAFPCTFDEESMFGMSALLTSLRKTDSSRWERESDSSGDFSAQTHLKLVGRDIDPPYMIGQCTECRRLFVYIL